MLEVFRPTSEAGWALSHEDVSVPTACAVEPGYALANGMRDA